MTIKQKQCLLAYLGYYSGAIDGIWGQRSRLAAEAFQRNYSLTVTGEFDESCESRIREAIATGQEGKAETFWAHIRYWRREEFRCQCGGKYCDGFPAEPDQTLVELADDIRHDLGAPGYRSSGLRCPQHNANEGGVSDSRHLTGKALDFRVEGKTGQQLLARALADKRTRYAYIIGSGPYVHVDVQ